MPKLKKFQEQNDFTFQYHIFSANFRKIGSKIKEGKKKP